MKLLLMTVLVLATAATCSGWLIDDIFQGGKDIIGGTLGSVTDAFKKLFDYVTTTANNLMGISTNILGKIFLDPFKVFQPDTDTDHGHSLGMVPHCPALADVIFVMDASSSVGSSDFQKAIQFNRRITEHFEIGPNNVRFGAVVFSDEAQEVFGLDDYYDHLAVAAGLRRTPYLSAGSKTWTALELIKKHDLFGSRRAQKIVVLLTDGQSSSIGSTTSAASALKSNGVEIIVVGTGAGISFELMSIASGQEGHNYFSTRRYSDLLVIEQRVARRICEIPAEKGYDPPKEKPQCPVGHEQVGSSCVDIDECSRGNPCAQNCINAVGGFRCICNTGYVVNAFDDKQCDKVQTCHAMADVIFVIDASGSMGTDNFKLQLSFASKLVKQFTIGPNNVRFGGLIFGTQVQKLFDLKDFSTADAIGQALKTASYLQGGTNTHLAFRLVKDGMFDGGRAFAEDVVILLTDGESSRPDDTLQAATELKDGGVRILVVGVGNEVSTEEIQNIASTPEDAFQVANFEFLTYIEQQLKERTCYQELGTIK